MSRTLNQRTSHGVLQSFLVCGVGHILNVFS